MKKVSIIFLVLYLFTSCDPPAYYNYYITNNCNEEIEVKIKVCTLNCGTTFPTILTSNVQINPNTTQLIHSNEDFQPLSDLYVEWIFEEIMIVKGSDTSKVNYVNKNLWDFRETSKDHADSYLTITPKDFE
jgi:hypothetical protein